MADPVAAHYGVTDLSEQILAALRAEGKDLDALTVDDLAPYDAFHIRGRSATQSLLAEVTIGAAHMVLDVGCGIGGTSRFIAARCGCRVLGVDLTPAYCRTAEILSRRVGLAEHTCFQPASALQLPFDDARFDVVWTEHVQMNIADKARFYKELSRVLRPGGYLAFHDIFAGPQRGLHYPVPWAPDESISHLLDVEQLPAILEDAGLQRVHWQDNTAESIAFFDTAVEAASHGGPPRPGIHVLMGTTAALKFGNVLRNLKENRLRVMQAVMRRSS